MADAMPAYALTRGCLRSSARKKRASSFLNAKYSGMRIRLLGPFHQRKSNRMGATIVSVLRPKAGGGAGKG